MPLVAPTTPIMPPAPIKPITPPASAVPFDPSKLLPLKFRGRTVVVARDRCSDYDVGHSFWKVPSCFQLIIEMSCPLIAKQGVIAAAQRSLRFLRPLAQEDLVVMAVIRDFDDKAVEVSKEAWPHVTGSEFVESVTIFLESGASPMASCLFHDRQPRSGVH
jgi:hypothetical protein